MRALELFAQVRSVLCVVAHTEGSCPGRTGFKMTVPFKGPCVGSIGGGGLEHRVILEARRMLGKDSASTVLRGFVHSGEGEPEHRSGMICSGRQTVILSASPALNVLCEDTCGVRITAAGVEFLQRAPSRQGLLDGENWEYLEYLKPPPQVYLFGGGHCSKALTPVLNSLGMKVTVVDDRESVHTMETNTEAWRRVRADYSSAGSLVPDDGTALVVIMTASHGGDAVILEQMLRKDLRYLGMMASRSTSSHLMGMMAEKGFTAEQLSRVHSPVGLPIGSHSPAEIAVSIAAEMIAVLNGKDQR